eukprot:753770-Hanusia_phi.AAC.2
MRMADFSACKGDSDDTYAALRRKNGCRKGKIVDIKHNQSVRGLLAGQARCTHGLPHTAASTIDCCKTSDVSDSFPQFKNALHDIYRLQ